MAKKKKSIKSSTIVNKKARFEYEILDSVDAGIILSGAEVKSLRLGRANLMDSFVRISQGQAFLHNAQISPYSFADNTDYDPKRTRKLLMHKAQILALDKKTENTKETLVPLDIHLEKGKFKVKVGLARGKKTHEKRAHLRQRDIEREVKREFKQNLR